MKPILIAGISIVNIALIAYSVGIITLLRTKKISRRVLTWLTLGVVFDITATLCMILGSDEGPMTLHGFIGYSSLLGMLADTLLSYRKSLKEGLNVATGKRFNNWSRIAWMYWILAYITGAIIVMVR